MGTTFMVWRLCCQVTPAVVQLPTIIEGRFRRVTSLPPRTSDCPLGFKVLKTPVHVLLLFIYNEHGLKVNFHLKGKNGGCRK